MERNAARISGGLAALVLAVGTSQAALTITSNPLGLVSLSPNPMQGATCASNLTLEANLAFDRNLNNPNRTRGVNPAASTGYFTWTAGAPFPVGTLISVDWAWPGWGGTYTYRTQLDSTDLGISRTAPSIYKAYMIHQLPAVQAGVTSLTFNFTQLQDDYSATIFEAWLVPERLDLLPLTAAAVSYSGTAEYGSRDCIFNDDANDEYLVQGTDTVAKSMTIDLGGTQEVKALLVHSSWRSTSGTVSYYDGSWHPLVGVSCLGDDADVLLLSEPVSASMLKVDFDWIPGSDGWAGYRAFQVFTAVAEAPTTVIPEPATLALVAFGGLLVRRRRGQPG